MTRIERIKTDFLYTIIPIYPYDLGTRIKDIRFEKKISGSLSPGLSIAQSLHPLYLNTLISLFPRWLSLLGGQARCLTIERILSEEVFRFPQDCHLLRSCRCPFSNSAAFLRQVESGRCKILLPVNLLQTNLRNRLQ